MTSTGRIVSQLRELKVRPGLWSGCSPTSGRVDEDLRFMIDNGLVQWRIEAVGRSPGYIITQRGSWFSERQLTAALNS